MQNFNFTPFLVAVFFVFGSKIFAHEVVFHIQSDLTENKNISVILKNNTVQQKEYKISWDKTKNETYFAIDIDAPQFATFNFDNDKTEIFIEPNSELSISFSSKNFLNTLKFNGKNGVNNTFLMKFYHFFRSNINLIRTQNLLNAEIDDVTSNHIESDNPAAYANWVNEKQEEETDFIFNEKRNLSTGVYSYLYKNIHYTRITRLYAYFYFKKFADLDAYKRAKYILRTGEDFDFADYERNETPVFKNALKMFLQTQFQKQDNDANALYAAAEHYFSGYDRYWLQKELFLDVLKNKQGNHFGKEKWLGFETACPFKELTQEVKYAYDLDVNSVEKEIAPDFEFATSENLFGTLSKYKGKVVYMSFWASWCAPCINNFRKYDDVRRKLESMGVVLLNISIDEQSSQFKEAIGKLSLTGVSALPIDLMRVKRSYNLYSIPTYYIVNKKGELVTLSQNANRDVVAEFQKLLQE